MTPLHQRMLEDMQRMLEDMQLCGLSARTQEAYAYAVATRQNVARCKL